MLRALSLFFLLTSLSYAEMISTDHKSDFKHTEHWTLGINPFFQTVQVDITESEVTNATSGSFTYFGSSADIYKEVRDDFHLHGAYILGYSTANATSYDGFELGGRYYFKGRGGKTTTETPQVKIQEIGSYAFWVEANYKQIKFESQTTFIKYTGFNFKVGGEYRIFKELYLGTHLGYDILSSGEFRSLTALNLGLSLMHAITF